MRHLHVPRRQDLREGYLLEDRRAQGSTVMALDTVIRGGTIVDGSGKAHFSGDIGISDGRIVEIGKVTTAARRMIDADGLIVSPGFIDGHTHMDAQIAWDPWAAA